MSTQEEIADQERLVVYLVESQIRAREREIKARQDVEYFDRRVLEEAAYLDEMRSKQD